MVCEQWDLIVVPFPFSEGPGTKKRPATVISKAVFNRRGHSVMSMITSAGHQAWPGDVRIADYRTAGLDTPCILRLKLFTLDNRLILKKIGRLNPADRRSIAASLHEFVLPPA